MIKTTDSGIIIDELNIDIPVGPIGIGFTGGADCTILAYILMKYHPGMIHFFTIASKLTMRGEALITIRVIDKLMDLSGRTENFMQHIVYFDRDKNERLGGYLMSQAEFFKTDVVYTGINEAPSDGIISIPLSPDLMEIRKPNIIKETYSKNRKLYHPLINIDKRGIKRLYDIFEVTDTLFPLTASCHIEELDVPLKGIRGLNNTTHCNNCWWCEERRWGFGRL